MPVQENTVGAGVIPSAIRLKLPRFGKEKVVLHYLVAVMVGYGSFPGLVLINAGRSVRCKSFCVDCGSL